MDLKIINPQQDRCSRTTASQVIRLFKKQEDKNMVNSWPGQVDEIIKKMHSGQIRLAVLGGKIVGCVAVKEYLVAGWARISWPFILQSCRYIGIENELIWDLCQDYHKSFRLIMPVRAPINQLTLDQLGFRTSSFAWLRRTSSLAWQETCVCHSTMSCPRADNECLLLIR